jgi:hypothetical protein
MSGKEPQLSPLELRKLILITESELNRVQLMQEWDLVTAPVRGFAERARSFGSMATSAASLATGLYTFRRHAPAPAAGKPSWIDAGLKAMRLAASIALAFRAKGDKEETK